MLHSLQETKCDPLLLLLLLQPTQANVKHQNHSKNKKQHSSSIKTAPKRVDCNYMRRGANTFNKHSNKKFHVLCFNLR